MKFSHNEEFAYEKGYRVVGNKVFSHTGKVRKTQLNDGYPTVQVWKDGKRCEIRVHRLVAYQKYGAEIYISGVEARHLDGSRDNFSDENIVIGTRSENMFDRPEELRKHIGNVSGKAAREVHRKFSDHGVLEVRKKLLEGRTQASLAKEYGVTQSTISQIGTRKTFSYLKGCPINLVEYRRKAEEARIKTVRKLNSKLTDKEVLEIRERISKGELQKVLAEEYHVCNQTISNIKLRKTFAHLG